MHAKSPALPHVRRGLGHLLQLSTFNFINPQICETLTLLQFCSCIWRVLQTECSVAERLDAVRVRGAHVIL